MKTVYNCVSLFRNSCFYFPHNAGVFDGTKPMRIDVLIIKKSPGYCVKKNIGRIFREHNIIEYKSPEDYLSIDDYYKVNGYACFYKSDTKKVDKVKAGEITLTFVCKCYPKKMLHILKKQQNLLVKKQERGIYYIHGAMFPVQLLVTRELSKKR